MSLRKWAWALLATGAACGCGNPLQGKVVGVWRLDTATVSGSAVATLRSRPEWKEIAARLEKERYGFAADGTLTVANASRSGEAGEWRLHGNTIVVTGTRPGDQANTPSFKVSQDGTRIHMKTPDGGMEADLIRAQ